MQNQTDSQAHAPMADNVVSATEAPAHELVTERKPFVEPRISAPTDVLEATKFFAEPVGSGFI